MSDGVVSVVWLAPLFTNAGGAEIVVGVTPAAEWYLQLDSPIRFTSTTFHPSILPLVQPNYGGDYATARSLLSDRLTHAGLPASLADSFPYFAVIQTAFRSSGFWARHAVEWLPHVEFDEAFARILLQFTSDKQRSQADRHLVAKHLHCSQGWNNIPRQHDTAPA